MNMEIPKIENSCHGRHISIGTAENAFKMMILAKNNDTPGIVLQQRRKRGYGIDTGYLKYLYSTLEACLPANDCYKNMWCLQDQDYLFPDVQSSKSYRHVDIH
jgi:hypothetical protein